MRRAGGLAVGAALVACSVALVGGGVFAAIARSGDTYVSLGAHGSYATDRFGLATESTNWRTTFLGWVGTVRLRVASADGKPIFAGVAAPDAIGPYLSGAAYTTIGDHGVRRDHAGAPPAIPPASVVDWTAYAVGAGTQTLRWKASAGRQVAFAMNADGSSPVRVRIDSSAVTLGRMPWWVPAGLLALGVLLLPAAILVLRRTLRARARRAAFAR